MSSENIAPVFFGGGAFNFTPVPPASFEEDHATLVGIAADVTGSMQGHTHLVDACIKAAIGSCAESPFVDHLLVRVTEFDEPSRYWARKNGMTVREILPFTKLADVDVNAIPATQFDGSTTVVDACFDGVVAIDKQGRQLRRERVKVNGILFVITDGDDNASKMTPNAVKEALAELKQGPDAIESVITILIGINAARYEAKLKALKDEAGFDYYVDAGNATEEELAKLSGYIMSSVSSQSQAAGSGRPSQNIAATI